MLGSVNFQSARASAVGAKDAPEERLCAPQMPFLAGGFMAKKPAPPSVDQIEYKPHFARAPGQVEPHQKSFTERKFLAAMRSLNVSEAQSRASLKMLQGCYSEPQRHYHTWAHIESMLTSLDAHTDEPIESPVVVLAIFFHDSVYNPRRHDNEDASKALFVQWAQNLDLPVVLQTNVVQFIEQTKHHSVEGGQRADLALFLDLDLEVLSRPSEAYGRYAEQVRREYAHVPTPLFSYLRANILRQLLERPTIYASENFRRAHEREARQNTANELERLEQNTRGFGAKATIAAWRCANFLRTQWHKITWGG